MNLGTFFITALLFFAACTSPGNDSQKLQNRIDSLQARLDKTYKPGLGEFMSGIQVHHAKLWFAGNAQNWPLASFEVDEIRESVGGIKQYCTDRQEIRSLPMIEPALDSISIAIKGKDLLLFKSSYVLLTNTCNNCHRATEHEFNVIKIPDTPPFANQDFKPR